MSPIKGISDKRRLTRVGKLRLGEKKKAASGSEYPSAVDYFLCKEDESTSENAARAFAHDYGVKPKEIKICFPSNEPDKFFEQWLKRYGKTRGLICKGNGETASAVDEATGEMVDIDCDPSECPYYEKKQCREVASLQFFMPDITGIGAWQIDTGSYNSIVNLNSAIEQVMLLTGGRIAFVPLELIIREKKAHFRDANGKEISKMVNVLDIAMERLDVRKLLASAQSVSASFGVLPESTEAPGNLFTEDALEANDSGVVLEGELIEEDGPSEEDIRAGLRDEIKTTCEAMKWEKSDIQKFLKDQYRCETFADLTIDQLIDCRDRLKIIHRMSD